MPKKLNQMALFLTIATVCAVLYAAYIFFFVEYPKNEMVCKFRRGNWETHMENNLMKSSCLL